MTLLNEVEKRRENFQGGIPVEMADGQVWFLARPRVGLRRRGPEQTGLVATLPGHPDYQGLLDRVAACHEFNEQLAGMPDEEGNAEWAAHPELHLASAELNAAHALLTANYDLTDDEADPLLVFCYDPEQDPDGFARRKVCMDAAHGRVPKPSPDGSTPA